MAAVTDVGEMVGGVEPRSALLSAAATTGGSGEAATTGVEAGSSGAGEVGSGGLLVAPSVLGRAGGRREVSRLGPTLTVSDAPAACSLWSLAGATGGAVMVVQAFQAQGAAGPAASGLGAAQTP